MNVREQSYSPCTDQGAIAPGGRLLTHARQLLPDHCDPGVKYREVKSLRDRPQLRVLVLSFGARGLRQAGRLRKPVSSSVKPQ